MRDCSLEERCRPLKTSMTAGAQEACWQAVQYLLERIQNDADLWHLCGPGTESFARLCRAEAAVVGQKAHDHQNRHHCLDPNEPLVVTQERSIERLRDKVHHTEVVAGDPHLEDDAAAGRALREATAGDWPFCSACGEALIGYTIADVGQTCPHCFSGVLLAPAGMVRSAYLYR